MNGLVFLYESLYDKDTQDHLYSVGRIGVNPMVN